MERRPCSRQSSKNNKALAIMGALRLRKTRLNSQPLLSAVREVLWAGFVSTAGATSGVLRAAGTCFKWGAIKEIPSGTCRRQPSPAFAASGSLLFVRAPSSTAQVGCHTGVGAPPATVHGGWMAGCSPDAVKPLTWCHLGHVGGRLEMQTGTDTGSRHLELRCAVVLPRGSCWSTTLPGTRGGEWI